jgi:hypothetical protein
MSPAELPASPRPAILLTDDLVSPEHAHVSTRFDPRSADAHRRRRVTRSHFDRFFTRQPEPNQSRLISAEQRIPGFVPQVTFWKPRLRQIESHRTPGRTAMLIASLVIAQLTVSAAVLAIISLLDRR